MIKDLASSAFDRKGRKLIVLFFSSDKKQEVSIYCLARYATLYFDLKEDTDARRAGPSHVRHASQISG